MPVTETATSAPSRSRAPAAIAAAVSAETAPYRSSVSRGTPSSRSFTSFAYATIEPRKTSLEPGHRREPRRDHAAGARLGRRERPAARAAEVEHDLLDPALLLAEQVPREPRRATRPRARPQARTGRRGSRSRARRSSRRRPAARRPPRRARARPPTRSRRRSAGRGARAASRVREHAPHRLGLERARPEPLQLRGRPGQDDDGGLAGLRRTRPGAVPASPSDTAPSGSVACFAHARLEVRVRALAAALRRRARSARSRASQPLVDVQRQPRGARDELDRAVVVRRPEAARDDAEVRAAALREARPRARASSSPTIVIDAGSSPSRTSSRARNGPLRSVPVAADELAARDDESSYADAKMPRAVTTNACGLPPG